MFSAGSEIDSALAQCRQYANRMFDRVIDGQSGLVQPAQCRGTDRRVQAVDHQWFVGFVRQFDHRFGTTHLVTQQVLRETDVIATEHADQEYAVDVVVFVKDFHAFGEQRRTNVGAARHVDRIDQRGLRQKNFAQAMARGVAEHRKLQSGFRQPVGCDRCLAATIRNHRNAFAACLLQQPQTFGHRQDFVRVLHDTDADLTQDVDRHCVAAGQCSGMRTGRLATLLGGAGLVHHHRLGCRDFTRNVEEAASVTETLDVERGDAGVRVFAQIAQIVVETDVGLIAWSDIGAEADMAIVFRFQHQRQQHVARLRDEADIAGLDIGQVKQIELLVQIEHSRRIGTDHAHAALTRGIQ